MKIASRDNVRRWGAGTAAIVRALIAADRPLTGVALAEVVSVKVTSDLNQSKSTTALVIGKSTPINTSGRSWAWATIASLLAALVGIGVFFSMRASGADDTTDDEDEE